jgi:hypothetical protein
MLDTHFPRYRSEDLRGRLPADVEVASWMLTDGDKASALWILCTFSPDDARVWDNVRYNGIDFAAIVIAEGWSPTESALLRAAASIAGYRLLYKEAVDLSELASGLDEDRWSAFLGALAIRREKLRG